MESTTKLVLIRGKIAHSLSRNELQTFDKAVLCFSRTTGAILFLEEDKGQDVFQAHGIDKQDVEVIELSSKQFLIPGFIDTHFHAPQYAFIGNGGDLTLLNWLREYTFPMEARYKDVEFAKKVYSKVVQRQLENGTTYCSYFATTHVDSTNVLADECIKQGQRALVGKVCSDMNAGEGCLEKLEDSLEGAEAVVKYVLDRSRDPGANKNNLLVRPVITPRFAVSCTMELMKGLAKIAEKYDVPFQTHLSEEKGEIDFVKEHFKDSTCYANVYEMSGLLGKPGPKTIHRAILAHCVHLTKDEKEILKKYDCGISHCGNSNVSIMSGLIPTKDLMNEGHRLSLGTDVAGGYAISMLDSIRFAVNISKILELTKPDSRLSLAEVFYLATLGGAEVLSSEQWVGNFAAGKQFDGVVVSLQPGSQHIDVFEEAPRSTDLKVMLEKFIFCGDDRNIQKVFVNGREVCSKK